MWTVNPLDDTPLYRQLSGQARRAIGDGNLRRGERLPPVRELADSLGINLHTVRQAYAELQREGLVEMRRGRGVTVVADGPLARVNDLARQLRDEGRRVGMTTTDLIRLLEAHP